MGGRRLRTVPTRTHRVLLPLRRARIPGRGGGGVPHGARGCAATLAAWRRSPVRLRRLQADPLPRVVADAPRRGAEAGAAFRPDHLLPNAGHGSAAGHPASLGGKDVDVAGAVRRRRGSTGRAGPGVRDTLGRGPERHYGGWSPAHLGAWEYSGRPARDVPVGCRGSNPREGRTRGRDT